MLTSGNAGVVDVSFVFAGVVCIISEPALLRCFDIDKPRGASPGREDGISTNNLVLFYGVE